MDLKRTLAANVKRLMGSLSQTALGKKAGISQSTVSRVLDGQGAASDIDTLGNIASAFAVPPWELLMPPADHKTTVSHMRSEPYVVAPRAHKGLPPASESLITDGRKRTLKLTQIIEWYEAISPVNQRKLWAQAYLYASEGDPDGPDPLHDPFAQAGIPIQKNEGIHGNKRALSTAAQAKGKPKRPKRTG